MKKYVTLLAAVLINTLSFSQTIDTNYFPEYNNTASKSDYNRGKELLKNAYDQISNREKIYYADYWNVAFAFSHMGVKKEVILNYLKKSKVTNHESFCKIVNLQIDARNGLSETPFYKLLRHLYEKLIADCKGISIESFSIEEKLREKEKLNLNNYNEKLIDKLIICMEKDQRYRTSPSLYKNNMNKQNNLDKEVQEQIIEILQEFGYPGKDLVGEPFMNYACLLIEHGGTLDYQEKYLPIVVKAYHNNQMDRIYLHMLIDRVQWKKTGKQIFGSHRDIPFETAEVIDEVKNKYGLK